MFAHPEFYFRTTGVWTGWNIFLGINKTTRSKEYYENFEQDRVEGLAYAKMMGIPGPLPQ